jgi:hypothetical protein
MSDVGSAHVGNHAGTAVLPRHDIRMALSSFTAYWMTNIRVFVLTHPYRLEDYQSRCRYG